MKRVLPIYIIVLCLFFYVPATAQNSNITFDSTRHNFGTIAEDGGIVTTTFNATNTTDTPIVILSVSGGCSCTTADFERKPILPDKASAITIHFDPMNQPEGAFMRKIIVTTSKGSLPLTILGNIKPRKKSIDEQYPLILGQGVRMESNAHAFGYIEHGTTISSTIAIINTSPKSVTLNISPKQESGQLWVHYPNKLQSGEQADINFGYTLAAKSDIYGSLNEVLDISIDNNKASYQLIISAIAIDRRNLSTDKEWQKIQLSENFIKFGTLKPSAAKVSRTIAISNIGLENLIIRKIECNNDLFDIVLAGDSTIQSDRRSELKVSFDPAKGMYGANVGRVTIISNDPQQPTKSFKVSAIVEN